MALNANNVMVAPTGGVYYDPDGSATPPTGTGSDISAFVDLGYTSEDGVTLTMPDSGSATSLKAWQNGAVVRILRAAPEDTPTLAVTLIETKLETIELAFGAAVTQTSDEGGFVVNTNDQRTHMALVVDVIDGDQLIRIYAPHAIVTGLDAINLNGTSAIGYGLTIALEFDQALNGQAQVWMTALKEDDQTP